MRAYQRLLFGIVVIMTLATANHVQAADKFRNFKLETLDGTNMKFEDIGGEVTVVAFFFPTCTYCNQAFPETVKVYEKYRDQGLTMVWINLVKEEEELIPEWLAEHDYDVPVLIGASQQSLARKYDLRVTPTHFIVDRDRKILFKQSGYSAGYEEDLEENVRQALNLTQ